jgi:NAD(P)-dependent dehydrogenase (short-subunit alcohol dehydrogenase family)
MSYKDLVGKTFVVTGAGSGIGRATALLLANQGANIGLLDLTTPEKVAEEVTKKGCSCIAIACNVQLAAEVDHAIKLVVDEFGVLDGSYNYLKILKFFKSAVLMNVRSRKYGGDCFH